MELESAAAWTLSIEDRARTIALELLKILLLSIFSSQITRVERDAHGSRNLWDDSG